MRSRNFTVDTSDRQKLGRNGNVQLAVSHMNFSSNAWELKHDSIVKRKAIKLETDICFFF